MLLRTPCLLPVVHIKNLEQCLRNVEMVVSAGCGGVFLIDHEANDKRLVDCATEVSAHWGDHLWLGINALGNNPSTAMKLAICSAAKAFWCDDMEIDEMTDGSVRFSDNAVEARSHWVASGLTYFGSVAFKGQPQVKNLGQMVRAASCACDVVVTSGDATGSAPDLGKIISMRSLMHPLRPLAIASGVSAENLASYLPYADIFMVASSISRSFHELDYRLLKQLQDIVRPL